MGQEKVLHPTSRKVLKMSKKETHRSNVESKGKIGIQRMSSMGEKLVWIKDSLPAVMDDEGQMTKDAMLELVTGLLSRFDEELEQINIKNSIGGKNRRSSTAAGRTPSTTLWRLKSQILRVVALRCRTCL